MKTPKKNGLEFYSQKDLFGIHAPRTEYRWRIYKQGRIIAASTEGYSRLRGAENNIKSIGRTVGFLIQHRIAEAIAAFKSKKKR